MKGCFTPGAGCAIARRRAGRRMASIDRARLFHRRPVDRLVTVVLGRMGPRRKRDQFPAKEDRRRRHDPRPPGLARYLAQLPAGVGKALLLPRLSGKSGTGKSGLSMAFKRIMEHAGIDAGDRPRTRRRGGPQCLQAFFPQPAPQFYKPLANAGVAAGTRQQLTGHSDAGTHQKYTHLELDSFRRAIAALPALPP